MSVRGWAIFIGIGAVLGLGLGLLISWGLYPVRYVDTEPHTLREDYRVAYLTVIARAYAATGDAGMARERLALFPEGGDASSLAALAQQSLAAGRSEDDARALAALAAALDADLAPATVTPTPSPTLTLSPTPAPSLTPSLSPTPSLTLKPTPTASPVTPAVSPFPPLASTASPGTPATPATPGATLTPAATATPAGPFELVRTELVCRPALVVPLIMVQAFDANGQPAPGVEFIVTWESGQDHFFTGLKPELGPGYGDFEMAAGVAYAVRPAPGGEVAGDLLVEACEDRNGASYPGSWQLTYQRP